MTNSKKEKTLEFLAGLATQLERLNSQSTAIQNLHSAATALQALSGVKSLKRLANNISDLAPALNALNSTDLGSTGEKIRTITEALSGLATPKGASSFGSIIKGLKDLPDAVKGLTPEVLSQFAEKVKVVSDAITPLSQKMTTIKQGFQAINKPIKEASSSVENFDKKINNINFAAIIKGFESFVRFGQKAADVVLKLTEDVIDFDGIVERFRRGFGDTASEAYSWIEKLNQEMGLNIQTFMQYTSIFAQMLEGLGVAQKDATQMAIGYSELSYDIWAAYNDIFKDYSDAVSAVQSAIAGQTRPLRRAGFSVLNTTLQQTAANHGLEISITKATEAEKSYLRYLSLVDQAQEQGIIGTYAKEMETAEGQLRTLGQMFKSLTQEAGKLLLPLLTVVVPRVQAAVKLITEAIQRLAGLFGVTLKTPEWSNSSGFAEAVEDAEDAAEGIESAMGGAAGSAKELKKTLLGIDEINQLNGANGGSGGGGGGGGSSVVDALNGYDWDVSSLWTEAIFKDINKQVDDMVEKFKDAIPIIENVALIAGGIALGALLADIEMAKTAFSVLGAIALDVGLNIAFTELTLRTDMSVNPEMALLGVLGQWLSSAGTGLLIGKAISTSKVDRTGIGLGIGFAVGAAVQIVVTAVEVASGNVELFGDNWWLQTLSTLGMGAAAGFAFGGVKGAVIGVAATLAIDVVATYIAWKNGGAAHKEALEKFGEGLGLTEDEIRVYAETMILTPRTVKIAGENVSEATAIEMLADVRVNINQARENIKSSMLSLETDLTKLRLGITVNPSTLKQDVQNYISAVQSYIDNTYQQGAISLSLLGMEESPLQEYLDSWYQNNELADLQERLNEIVTEGTITVANGGKIILGDAAKAYWITKLSKEIQQVIEEAAQLQYDAELTALRLTTQGDLSFDEIISAINKAVESASNRGDEAFASLKVDIGLAMNAFNDGFINSEEYDTLIEEAYRNWINKTVSLTDDVLSYGFGLLNDNYSTELAQLYAGFDEQFGNLNRDTYNSIKSLVLSNIGNLSKSLPDGAKALMEEIVNALMPTVQQQQRLASELLKTGRNVDQSLIDGLNDAQMLAAMLGSVDAQWYMVGLEYSSSPEFYELLQTAEDCAERIDKRAYEGLVNNLDIVYDAATGMITGINNKITGEALVITPLVRDTLAKLGINIPEGLVQGAETATDATFGGQGSYGNYLVKSIGKDLSTTLTPDKFAPYGKAIPNGVKSGASTTPSWFNPTVQSYQTDIQTAFRTYMSEKEWVKYGQAVPGGVKSGMGNGSDLNSHASWLLKNINPNIDEAVRGMKNIGGNLVKGILQGMETESESTQTKQSLGRVMTNLDTHTRVKALIGSPSKLFAEDVGYWLTAGIVEGMNQPYALIEPMEVMYTNAKDWWDSNTTDITGGDFEFIDESGKNHYLDIKDANNEQNSLLREQNQLLRQILEKESTGGYYGTTGEAMLEAASHLNRRTGRTMIPVGG